MRQLIQDTPAQDSIATQSHIRDGLGERYKYFVYINMVSFHR